MDIKHELKIDDDGKYYIDNVPVTRAQFIDTTNSEQEIQRIVIRQKDVKPVTEIPPNVAEDTEAFDNTLTEEEKTAPTFIEWSDETLGRMVKQLAKNISDTYGGTSAAIQGAAMVIANQAHKSDSSQTKILLKGYSSGEEQIGDYLILCVRVDEDDEELRAESSDFLEEEADDIRFPIKE